MSIFVDPRKAVEALSIEPGMSIADVGCGVGHYIFAVAEKLNGKGKIYGIDVRKSILEKVVSEAKERGLSEVVEIIWGDAEKERGTKLADGSVDVVIASNIFFQVEDRSALAGEIARIAVPGGEVLVIDWVNSFGGLGPPDEHIISPEEIKETFAPLGLDFQGEHKTGTHHYELLFKKKV